MAAPRVVVFDRTDTFVRDLDPKKLLGLTSVEEINGEHSLTISTLEELAKDDRVLVRDGMLDWHEFVIEGVTAEHGEAAKTIYEYYCVWSLQHDLAATYVNNEYGCGIRPGKSSVMHPASDALAIALAGTSRWAVGSVTVTTGAAASFYRRSGWEALQTVVEKWGGSLTATIEVGLSGVLSRSVNLLAHEGKVTPTRRFDWGWDVASITRTVSDDPWPCRIIPLGASQETEAGGYTRRPDISSVNGGVVWLENPSVTDLVKVSDGQGGWEYPTVIVENDTYEDPADLLAWAQASISDYTSPKVSYEADVVQLAEAGLDPHGVAIGDEVVVVDRGFGSDGLRISARVMRIECNLLDPTDTTLTIGNAEESLAGRLTGIARQVAEVAEQQARVDTFRRTEAYVSALIDRLNTEANATGGYTYITEGQGIRTYDVPVSDPLVGSEASQVVEVKGGTIRIANTRDASGDWEWRTVIVSGHVAADMVTASNITTGYVGSAGETYIDLDSNVVQLGPTDGFHVIIDETEIGFYQGSTRAAYVNGEKLWIPLGVVLDALQVGDEGSNCWRWELQSDGNLELVWIG